MLILKWLVVTVLVLAIVAIVIGQTGLLRGTPPADLGVRDGRLKPPSATENSVTSQATLYPEHAQRAYAQVAPLSWRGDGAETLARLKAIVERTPNARVVTSEPGYLYAQYTTPLMKYVDDVEFWVDAGARVVQVRSASRIGRKDLGANRKRIEAIRAALAAAP